MSKRKVKVVDAKTKLPVMTRDSFQNALARLGFNMPNMLEGTSYHLTRMTQNYQTLTTLYRNHWIIRKIVDVIPEDMCKNWVKLNTQVDPGQMKILEKIIRKTRTKEKILEGLKWGRLYGGAAGVILIDGQEHMLEQPLNYDLIMPGSYKGLLILDRWSGISPAARLISDINDPDFGLPMYYQMTMPDGKMLYVHHSRVLRFKGNALPLWESWAEQQWGSSVIESVYDELKKRDNTSFNIANLVFLANLRVYKTDMTDLLALGDIQMQQDFYKVMSTINQMMNNFGMTVMGSNDSLESHQYTFTGLNDVYESFMLDIAGACEIPVTRLFGRSPAGFNATGESDLTNYYDSIEEKQEAYMAPVLDKLLPVIALSAWGMIPDDLDYEFNPLRKADPKENAELAKSMAESVVNVYNASLISQQIALKELRQQSEITGMWSNITDENIAKADTEVDMGGELPGIPMDFNQASLLQAMDADWKEEDHPRREDGKFGSGGGKSNEEKPSKPDDEIIEKGSSSEKKTEEKSVEKEEEPTEKTEEKELTEEAKRSKLKSSSKGENIFTRGFSKRNLDRHWEGGTSDHSEQYPDLDKEGYSQRALDLVQMAVGGNIEGYANANGQVVRYDKESNDFVKGRPDEGIATMFKPKRGLEYFKERMKEEGVDDNEN